MRFALQISVKRVYGLCTLIVTLAGSKTRAPLSAPSFTVVSALAANAKAIDDTATAAPCATFCRDAVVFTVRAAGLAGLATVALRNMVTAIVLDEMYLGYSVVFLKGSRGRGLGARPIRARPRSSLLHAGGLTRMSSSEAKVPGSVLDVTWVARSVLRAAGWERMGSPHSVPRGSR